jgi:hypothetical protein
MNELMFYLERNSMPKLHSVVIEEGQVDVEDEEEIEEDVVEVEVEVEVEVVEVEGEEATGVGNELNDLELIRKRATLGKIKCRKISI